MKAFLIALADPLRREAPQIFWDGGEHCVYELMTRLDAPQSRMPRQLKTLREAGLVLARQDAQWVRYRRDPDLAPQRSAVGDASLAADKARRRTAA